MERNEIEEKLTAIFKDVFKDNSIVLTDDLTAGEVDNWDSLSHMTMITQVEQSFGIKFKLRDLNKMKKVGDLIDLISSKL